MFNYIISHIVMNSQSKTHFLISISQYVRKSNEKSYFLYLTFYKKWFNIIKNLTESEG